MHGSDKSWARAMNHNARPIPSGHLRLPVALLLCTCALSSQAQGHGSYGGIAGGFFALALIVVLVVAVILFVVIRAAFGSRAAAILLVAGLGFVIVGGGISEARRHRASKKIMQAYAEGCAASYRTIEHPAKGNERIFVRLHGAGHIPEFQRIGLVPEHDRVAEGVSVVTDLPGDLANAIVVDIRYDRELVPGSYSGHEFYRTRYSVKAMSLHAGVLVAQTVDMEAANGFCIGDLDGFLQQALNRSAVLWTPVPQHSTPARLAPSPIYVRAMYSGTTSGKYLESTNVRDSFAEAKKLMHAKNCSISESTISPPVALCGGSPHGAVEIPLGNILGVHAHGDSWLLVYREFKGMEPLTSLRVERRLADWRLAAVWRANMVPPPDNFEGREYLEEFAVDRDSISAAVYWDGKLDSSGSRISTWYAKRSLLRVPLPGLGN